MDSLNNKRACTSYRIMISVQQVNHYKDILRQGCSDSIEYCDAKLALERAIPEWVSRKTWSIARELRFVEQILDALGQDSFEALKDVRRQLDFIRGE